MNSILAQGGYCSVVPRRIRGKGTSQTDHSKTALPLGGAATIRGIQYQLLHSLQRAIEAKLGDFGITLSTNEKGHEALLVL